MNSLWNKKIPTLFAFLLILLGIGATAYLTVIGVIPFGHASPAENPHGIRVTNITDTSFTLTYQTDTAILGSIAYGVDSNFGQVALDDRDQSTGIPAPYTIHSITVRNLKPLTKYYYEITSGNTVYLNRDVPFILATGPSIHSSPPALVPLAGNVQLPNGSNPTEAIVYVSTQNGQTLSALVKPSGVYIIPLNTMRTESFTSYISFTDATTLELLIFGDSTQSRATLLANKRNPVPTITLSDNYDFTLNISPLASTSAVPIGFPAFSLDTTIQAQPKIETPVKNQTFNDSQPVLQGKAMPNATVKIEIHSQNTISKTVTADQYGNWNYRPDTPLAPGQHTITITTTDQSGILKTLQQTFTIFASGTQVAEAATPSASPTFAITPTNIPTPTATPTLIPSPTPTTISTPTASIAPTISTSQSPVPTKTQKIPATGNNTLITFGAITLVTTIAGIVLFLVSSGISL